MAFSPSGGLLATANFTDNDVSMFAPSTPPSTSIATPADGATYTQGQVVDSSFSCSDGGTGTGIASCLDRNGNPSGSAIDTSTTGEHTFTVTATGNDSLTATASVTYTVSPLNQGFNPGFNSGFNSGFTAGFRGGFQTGFTHRWLRPNVQTRRFARPRARDRRASNVPGLRSTVQPGLQRRL